MRRIGRWFAVKMVGADAVGVVWLPKFPANICWVSAQRGSDPRAGIRHLSVPGGKRKNLLLRPSLCLIVHSITQQNVTIPKFYSVSNFSKKLGHISEERNTTLRQGLLCRWKSMSGRRPTWFLAYQRLGRGYKLSGFKGNLEGVHTSLICSLTPPFCSVKAL